ncbi:MAG: beta-galactosidase [Acidobacteriota bacterium]|nr:beta-galactosidase [Acidobacteriota bacterium]
MFGSGLDIIETTGHLRKWREDLDLLRAAGVSDLRYPAPGHRIESSPGHFDFTWMDEPMSHRWRQGMNPVIDLLHHTSFPDWLDNSRRKGTGKRADRWRSRSRMPAANT